MGKDNQRIYFYDELRGFSVFIVIIAHFIIGFNFFKGYLYNPKEELIYPSWFIDLLPIDGAFGVAIFFLISGFVIPLSLSNRTSIKFIQSRVLRVYPLYAVYSTLGFILLSYFTYKVGMNIFLSLGLIIFMVTIMSFILHKYIELPSLTISQKIK